MLFHRSTSGPVRKKYLSGQMDKVAEGSTELWGVQEEEEEEEEAASVRCVCRVLPREKPTLPRLILLSLAWVVRLIGSYVVTSCPCSKKTPIKFQFCTRIGCSQTYHFPRIQSKPAKSLCSYMIYSASNRVHKVYLRVRFCLSHNSNNDNGCARRWK